MFVDKFVEFKLLMYFNITMSTETQTPTISRKLLDQSMLNDTTKWFNQQIEIAKKRVQLSDLNAQIAENQFKETLAYAKIAQLSAGTPDEDEANIKKSDKAAETHTTITAEVNKHTETGAVN